MSAQMSKKTYTVEIEEVVTHQYTVEDCNTPEEAESIAEQWLADGEQGTIADRDIITYDSYPVEQEG